MQTHGSIQVPATLLTEHASIFNKPYLTKNLKYYSNVKRKPNNTIFLNAKLRPKIQLNQRKK
jgi:hypothetical protein